MFFDIKFEHLCRFLNKPASLVQSNNATKPHDYRVIINEKVIERANCPPDVTQFPLPRAIALRLQSCRIASFTTSFADRIFDEPLQPPTTAFFNSFCDRQGGSSYSEIKLPTLLCSSFIWKTGWPFDRN